MVAGILYNSFKNDIHGQHEIESDIAWNAIQKYEFELWEPVPDGHYDSREIILTDSGKSLVQAIAGRLHTLKLKKNGNDMFPELAGLEDSDTVREYPGITSEIAEAANLNPGKLLLKKGNKDFGFRHILELHSEEISEKTKLSPLNFIELVSTKFHAIAKGKGNKILLCYKNGFKAFSVLQLDKEKGDYSIVTAYVATEKQYNQYKKLWVRPDIQNLRHLPDDASISTDDALGGKHQTPFGRGHSFDTKLNKKSSKKQKKDPVFEIVSEWAKEHGHHAVEISPGRKSLDGIFKPIDQVKPPENTITLPGDLGEFFGQLERNKCAITLEGDAGAGKSQFVMILANAFASLNMKVGIFSLEMGANSDVVKRYRDNYIAPENRLRVLISDELPDGMNTIRQAGGYFDVVIIDSFGKATGDNSELDKLRNSFPGTIWVPIFQRTSSGEIRGGTKAIFDASVNVEAVKVDDTFQNNYVFCSKNRYGATGQKYLISQQKLWKEASEK